MSTQRGSGYVWVACKYDVMGRQTKQVRANNFFVRIKQRNNGGESRGVFIHAEHHEDVVSPLNMLPGGLDGVSSKLLGYARFATVGFPLLASLISLFSLT